MVSKWFYALPAVALACSLFPSPAKAQTTRVVDLDGKASATDCNARSNAFRSIRAALDSAVPGDTVFVCPGIYDEQIEITTDNITLRGAGAGVTVLKPSAVRTTTSSLVTGTPAGAIVLVAAANVNIRSLTVDGSLADSGRILVPNCRVLPFFLGVFYREASGNLSSARVTGIASASACADAIRAESATLRITGNLIDRYTRGGVSCAGDISVCGIIGNTIRGLGPVTDQIQAGVQIRAAAAGEIAGNTIADHFLVGAHGVPQSSVGIFLVNAEPSSNPHLIQENVLTNNQVDVQRISTAAAF